MKKQEEIKNVSQTQEECETPEKVKFYTKPWVITVAAVLVVVLLAGILIGSTMVSRNMTLKEIFGFVPSRLDYLNDNLNKYVDLKDEYYKDYTIEVDIPAPGERDVEQAVLELLAANKNTKPLYDGKYRRDRSISPGDKVYFYYRGYTLDENGRRKEVNNANNFTSSTPEDLVIGSGDFVLGFELGLIGKIPNQYNDFSISTSGDVTEGAVAYITATYVEESGLIYEDAEIRVDFTDVSKAEALWGEGFYEYIREKHIGQTNNTVITLPTADGNQITYTNVKVNYVTRCEDNVVTVETVFPYDYAEKKLANATVYYDVFVEKVLCYDAPAFDDNFITETLKASAESLASYGDENDSLADKYREKILEELLEEYEDNIYKTAEELMWQNLRKNIKVELPTKEVDLLYKEYLSNYSNEYQRMNELGAGYEDFNEYMNEVFSLEGGSGWVDYLMLMVEEEITEKIIFYSIIRRENLVPTGEELEEIYRMELELDYEFYTGKTRDDFLTDADYNSAIADYEKQILDYYGKEFYLDSVYYNYASKKIIEFATINNKANK